jgi:hypothetical protein
MGDVQHGLWGSRHAVHHTSMKYDKLLIYNYLAIPQNRCATHL